MLGLHFYLHVTDFFLIQHRIKSTTSEANWDLAVPRKSCYLCINQSKSVLQKIRNNILSYFFNIYLHIRHLWNYIAMVCLPSPALLSTWHEFLSLSVQRLNVNKWRKVAKTWISTFNADSPASTYYDVSCLKKTSVIKSPSLLLYLPMLQILS